MCYKLSISIKFDLFIIFIVILNAIFMSLEGNLLSYEALQQIQKFNFYFNLIFIFEYSVKIIGLGVTEYYSDILNYLDFFIVIFGVVEMATESTSSEGSSGVNLKSLSVLRIFRIFRVLRLAKVLKKIKTMKKIMIGMAKIFDNVVYICLLLLIFMIIYILLGMSTLNSDSDFRQFLSAFYIVFQILTTENWNTILYRLFLISPLSIVYLVSWIFIGNYILFNLFLSILLDSFDSSENDQDDMTFPSSYPQLFKDFMLEHDKLINVKSSLLTRKRKSRCSRRVRFRKLGRT